MIGLGADFSSLFEFNSLLKFLALLVCLCNKVALVFRGGCIYSINYRSEFAVFFMRQGIIVQIVL